MVALTALLMDWLGDNVSIETLLKLAPILAPVIADFADDPHLSRENRLKVQEAVYLLREGKL